MRVVSLLPAATEIICRVGGRDRLVGRSHECDHPPEVASVPAVTGQRTHYDPEAGVDAAAIDRAVREQMRAHGGLYTLDHVAMAELTPNLIVTQEVCSVCSVDAPTVRAIADHMVGGYGIKPDVLSLDPVTIEDVLDDHLRVGRAIKREETAREAVVSLRERLFRAEEHVNPYTEGPVVGFLEWTDPLFIAGHWTVEMIERAGGRHPLNETVPDERHGAAEGPQRGGRRAGKSISVPEEAFAASAPEHLVICPCGLTLDQAWDEAQKLAEKPWFRSLPAVRNGRVAVVDGSAMFNRPGPRLIDAYEWLVGWLNDRPGLIPPEFPWRRMEREPAR